MESIFDGADQLKIQKSVYKDAVSFDKKTFNRAIQELYLTDRQLKLGNRTTARFIKIFDFLRSRLPEG